MKRWTVTDRQGRKIYLTEERWQHILSKHSELDGRLEDVLTTIRIGRRKQSKQDVQTFMYYRRVDSLPDPYNTILVFVACRYTYFRLGNTPLSNNFVTTAWGDVASK